MLKKRRSLFWMSTPLRSIQRQREDQSIVHANFNDTTVLIIAQRISSVSRPKRSWSWIRESDGVGIAWGLLKTNKIYQEINASQKEGVLND
jgi:hypothetical protein